MASLSSRSVLEDFSTSVSFGVWGHFCFPVCYDADLESFKLKHDSVQTLHHFSVSVFKTCLHENMKQPTDTQNKPFAAFLTYSIRVKEVTMATGKAIYGSEKLV